MAAIVLPGAILGFSSRDVVSDFICVMSLAPPGSIHHVGIVSKGDDEPLVYEAIHGEKSRPACYFQQKQTSGLQAHTVNELVEFIRERNRTTGAVTKVWCYNPRAPLYEHEEIRLENWLRQRVGSPYDLTGAWHSGGGYLFRSLSFLIRGESFTKLFCSETAIGGLTNIGRVQSHSASHCNPMKTIRLLRWCGYFDTPFQLV